MPQRNTEEQKREKKGFSFKTNNLSETNATQMLLHPQESQKLCPADVAKTAVLHLAHTRNVTMLWVKKNMEFPNWRSIFLIFFLKLLMSPFATLKVSRNTHWILTINLKYLNFSACNGYSQRYAWKQSNLISLCMHHSFLSFQDFWLTK